MGGGPRWVTDAPEGVSEHIQNDHLRTLQPHAHRIYQSSPTQTVGQTEQQSTDLLFRIEPDSKDHSKCIVQLASEFVERELAYLFKKERFLE